MNQVGLRQIRSSLLKKNITALSKPISSWSKYKTNTSRWVSLTRLWHICFEFFQNMSHPQNFILNVQAWLHRTTEIHKEYIEKGHKMSTTLLLQQRLQQRGHLPIQEHPLSRISPTLLIQICHLINNDPTDLSGNYAQQKSAEECSAWSRLSILLGTKHARCGVLQLQIRGFGKHGTSSQCGSQLKPNARRDCLKFLWHLSQLFKQKGIINRKPQWCTRCFKAIYWKRDKPGQRAVASQASSSPFSVILPQLKWCRNLSLCTPHCTQLEMHVTSLSADFLILPSVHHQQLFWNTTSFKKSC